MSDAQDKDSREPQVKPLITKVLLHHSMRRRATRVAHASNLMTTQALLFTGVMMAEKDKCWIWGTDAEIEGDSGAVLTFNSPRAGGKYRVTASVSSKNVKQLDPVKLTEWLITQRRLGDAAPTITSYTSDAVNSIPTPGVLEKRDRVLEFLARQSSRYGAPVRVAGNVDSELNSNLVGLQLAAQCRDTEEARAFLTFLSEGDLIAFDQNHGNVRVTFPGWQYVEKRRVQESALEQAFVAMWFHASMEAAFIDGIEPAIKECGYRAMRIDRKEHINKVDDEIVAEIRRSRFLVADFTSEPASPVAEFILKRDLQWAWRKELFGRATMTA
jgi:hypothetical protein